jgi:hypothetical protein
MLRISLALALLGLAACSHSPDTVVQFAAPSTGWEVRETTGNLLCAVPCVVGMDAHHIVVLAHDDGTRFVVAQDSLGAGTFSAAVHVRTEARPGALAVRAFAGALVFAGASVLRGEGEDRLTAGLILSGLGTAGLLASDAWPRAAHEELWVQRTSER